MRVDPTLDRGANSKIKRVIRYLFTAASVALLLTTLAVIALWVRSYRVVEKVEFTTDGKAYFVQTASGLLMVLIVVKPNVEAGEFLHASWPNQGDPWGPFTFVSINSLGFASISSPTGRTRGCVVPYWFLVCATGAASAPWLYFCQRRLRRVRAVKRGRCPTCGYDLRASKDRCPECATPILQRRGADKGQEG